MDSNDLSEQHHGLTFCINPDDETGGVPVDRIQSGPPTQGFSDSRRVLIVDDNVDSAESLGLLLSLMKHKVRIAHDGPTALKIVSEFQPEIVLLDIGLPGMDGYEIARRMRCQPETKQALLAAVTGYAGEEDRRRSREAGFDHHLVKPVGAHTLRVLLGSHNRPGIFE